ncbi:PRD domain-containing protein [Oceanobacillus oncorhynchi subsp. oncorhynchi]
MKSMLTNRQKEIASMLLNCEKPLLYRELADKCSVSLRTIKSDMKQVKYWFKKHQVDLQSQPVKGLWITNLNEKEKMKIYHKLLLETVDEEIWGEEGRIRRIVLLLSLHPRKYITAEFLADQLLVSKQTIYKDMKKVEKHLAENNITLKIFPRKGYTIAGEEVDIRQHAEYLLTYKIVIEESYRPEVYVKFKEELTSFSPDMKKVVLLIDEILMKSIKQSLVGYHPASVKIFTLFTRLVISVCRVTKENAIQLGRNNDEIDMSMSTFAMFVYAVANDVFEHFSLEITNDEFIYIYRNALLNNHNEDLIEMTNNIIHYVSRRLSIPFYNDSTLQTNLLSHFSNKFTEENAILLENNPFMEDLKTKHDYLYHPVKTACEKYIESHNFTSEMISSFVTLHFLVSMETTFENKKPLKALYVCASGRGVARVIKNRVEKEVPRIRIIQYCGLDDLEEIMEKDTFDIIISVFPIETAIPTIWVDPVPSESNIKELKNKVSELTGDNQVIAQQIINKGESSIDDPEEYSRAVILEAMELYLGIKQAFKGRIKHKMEDAFLMHVFLMVHRIKFRMEYDHLVNTSFIETEDYRKVDEVFKKQGLQANADEKKAILFYIEKEEASCGKGYHY